MSESSVAAKYFVCRCGAETASPLADDWRVPLDGSEATCGRCAEAQTWQPERSAKAGAPRLG